MQAVTSESLREAGRLLRAGRLVAFPTETVYGLGANGLDPAAVREIFRVKGRPADNPLILHVSRAEQAVSLAADWTPLARRAADAFWPGPLTLVVAARPGIPVEVRGGLDSVAVRVPRHAVARAVLEAAGVPVAAPSANRSGRPSPTTAEDVERDLGNDVAWVLDGGATEIGVESTVLDVRGSEPLLLRAGGLALECLTPVLGPIGLPDPTGPARSPGMRYRHYAPDTPVVLLETPAEQAVAHIRGTWRPDEAAVLAPLSVTKGLPEYLVWNLGETALEASHRLFRGLRWLEGRRPLIVAVWDNGAGLGRAVWNRLQRASAKGEPLP